MNCQYCHRTWKAKEGNEKLCAYCGAEGKPANTTSEQLRARWEPFVYEGYVVWCVATGGMLREWVFYKGTEFMGSVSLSWREVLKYGEHLDIMPKVYEMFQLQRGEIVRTTAQADGKDLGAIITFKACAYNLAKLDVNEIAQELDDIVNKIIEKPEESLFIGNQHFFTDASIQ